VLAPNGYAVMRAYTAKAGLERAVAHPPDLVFVSSSLPNAEGIGLCRALRDEAGLTASTPILMTSPDHPNRDLRLTALHAGAWDLISFPVDAQELILRLDAYVAAKFEADQARERCLVDDPTGFYNLRGLEIRAQELRSQAYREHKALACVVIAPVLETEGEDGEAVPDGAQVAATVQRLGRALKSAGRISDAIGRLGQCEFAIVAANTNAEGATRLAERLAAAIRETEPEGTSDQPELLELRAGYDAVPNVRETPVEARDLMAHATMALRSAKANGESGWIHGFEAGG
jgi:diguanylate cyclase (GGDEF)-like protein